MDDQENIRLIRQRELKEKEWKGIQQEMEQGSNKSIKQREQFFSYNAGSPWMERRSLTQEEVDYFEDKEPIMKVAMAQIVNELKEELHSQQK